MMVQPPRKPKDRIDRWLDVGEGLLESFSGRVFLSLLILASVLPPATYSAFLPSGLLGRLDGVFLLVFGPEVLLRLALYLRRRRLGKLRGHESTLLGLDFLALLSFFPWDHTGSLDLRFLRLARL